jgi:hypothetical protein
MLLAQISVQRRMLAISIDDTLRRPAQVWRIARFGSVADSICGRDSVITLDLSAKKRLNAHLLTGAAGHSFCRF